MAVIATLYFAREIFIPLAFAITFAIILSPAVTWLTKWRVLRTPAVMTMVILTIAAIGGIGFVIFNQLVQVLDELPVYKENIRHKIQAMRTPSTGSLGRAAENVKDLANELSTTPAPPVSSPEKDRVARSSSPIKEEKPVSVQIVPDSANDIQYIRDLTKSFLGPLGTLGIVLIFTIFLLIEQDDLRDRLFGLAGLSRLNLMTQALDDAIIRVSRYLLLQFLVNAGFGILWGIGLYFLGVPYAALWAAVTALLRIVPYLGSMVGALLPLILSLAVFDTWMQPLLVLLVFLFLELITANFLEPILYGSHTGISSLALLVTTVFWATLWGPAGLILSTPLTVCLVVLGRHVPQFSFLHVLLGDQDALTAEAQLYQRLLALDDNGARAVVERSLAASTALQVYDSVIVPTMTMLETDRHKGAIDADREEFIFMNVREMLSEVYVRTPRPEVGPIQPGRFLCLPANDESDEVTAAMLAQVLEAVGHVTISFPKDVKLQHTLRMIAPSAEDVFCISALPPFAFTQARNLTIQLRERYPDTKILVGVWGFSGDANRAVERFQPSKPDHFVTSFAGALSCLVAPASANTIEQKFKT